MKITEQWIIQAAVSLLRVGIVKRLENQAPVEYSFPKPFKGYISSFAATSVQSGLLPTLDIYEKEDHAAEAYRHLLPQAIIELLCRLNLLERRNGFRLSDYWEQAAQAGRVNEFRENVDKALVALKLAIRMYKAEASQSPSLQDAGGTNAGQAPACQPKVPEQVQAPESWQGLENRHANAGWLYYREYYRDYAANRSTMLSCQVWKNGRPVGNPVDMSRHEYLLKYQKNPFLLSSRLDEMLGGNRRLDRQLKNVGFASLTFRTIYPGLVIGLGLSHGTPAASDLKCGFQFDYATGLPVIPGSSVKGVIRSVFPDPDGKAQDEHNRKNKKINNKFPDPDGEAKDERNQQKIRYIAHLLHLQGIGLQPERMDSTVRQLTKQIFEHDDAGRKGVDVFMDAILTGPATGPFLADDFLAPHKGHKDPVPIQFLKVLPGIQFTFYFKLTPFCIDGKAVDKLALFRKILEDVGVGAKTNVGYGHLKAVE